MLGQSEVASQLSRRSFAGDRGLLQQQGLNVPAAGTRRCYARRRSLTLGGPSRSSTRWTRHISAVLRFPSQSVSFSSSENVSRSLHMAYNRFRRTYLKYHNQSLRPGASTQRKSLLSVQTTKLTEVEQPQSQRSGKVRR